MVLRDESSLSPDSLTAYPKFSELGQLLLNLVNVVPAGMVVFFSSYSTLDTVRRLWSMDRTLEKIGLRKKVSMID